MTTTMGAEEAKEVELDSVRRQVDIYTQIKKAVSVCHAPAAGDDIARRDMESLHEQIRSQLLASMKRYRKEGKDELAEMISRAMAAAA
jgi:hypothetical protein